jgi:hypothetical protein
MRALLPLLVVAVGCAPVMVRTGFEPAILRDSLPDGKMAVTLCAENNVPYIILGHRTQGLLEDESARVHEVRHTEQIKAHKGGCWPFLYRYRADADFRARMELDAYCTEGRWLLTRNRQPQSVWAHIALIMQTQHGMIVRENCLFEEGA